MLPGSRLPPEDPVRRRAVPMPCWAAAQAGAGADERLRQWKATSDLRHAWHVGAQQRRDEGSKLNDVLLDMAEIAVMHTRKSAPAKGTAGSQERPTRVSGTS